MRGTGQELDPDRSPKWVLQALPAYRRLSTVTSSLIESSIREKEVDFLSVSGRTKTVASITDKIKRKSYNDPRNQLSDISGVRVITFFESQSAAVSDVIRDLFEIDEENSMDRSKILGSDKIGYRSTHFVCTLGQRRSLLPEYKDVSNLKFEVQVRTVLQHAWAELAHDRSYKFGPGLPVGIQRKINLYSGMLEIADSGFDSIVTEIEEYTKSIEIMSVDNIKNQEITVATLSKFFARLKKKLAISAIRKGVPDGVFGEIKFFGLRAIEDLEGLVNPDFISAFKKYTTEPTEVGILRDLMMFSDLERYLSGPFDWQVLDEGGLDFLSEKYDRSSVIEMMRHRGIKQEDDADEDYEISDED